MELVGTLVGTVRGLQLGPIELGFASRPRGPVGRGALEESSHNGLGRQ